MCLELKKKYAYSIFIFVITTCTIYWTNIKFMRSDFFEEPSFGTWKPISSNFINLVVNMKQVITHLSILVKDANNISEGTQTVVLFLFSLSVVKSNLFQEHPKLVLSVSKSKMYGTKEDSSVLLIPQLVSSRWCLFNFLEDVRLVFLGKNKT